MKFQVKKLRKRVRNVYMVKSSISILWLIGIIKKTLTYGQLTSGSIDKSMSLRFGGFWYFFL